MTSVLDRDTLNAFCRHTHIEVAGAPTGPLAGLTFGVKDLYDIAGVGTAFGSPSWLATHPVPAVTAPVVESLLRAGASIVGKTQTDELAFSINGNNAHYGRPINPKADGRLTGGSSSGSAAAVAGGLCDFALGSDTGGSVRLPASFCGLYGLRPTHGRIPLGGACALARSFDTAGWFAADLDIFSRAADVLLSGARPACDRVLIAQDAFALTDPGVREALQPALSRIEHVLGAPRAVSLAAEGLSQWFETFRTLQFSEIWREHRDWLAQAKPALGPGIAERMAAASNITAAEIAKADAARTDITRRLADLLGERTVLILPTVPGIAPRADSTLAELESFRGRAMSLLCIASLTRLPQINLPVATLDGCPLGMSLMAPAGADEMLVEAARRLAG